MRVTWPSNCNCADDDRRPNKKKKRPDTTTCLMHPYFWDSGRRLGFLQDASDRFEIMCRDPRDLHLGLLENNAMDVVGPDWPARLDKIFVENLGKFRKYDGRSVQDLLRALRNKVRTPPNAFSFLRLTRSFRNTTTRTCLKTSDATSAPCLTDTYLTSHAVTLASSSTCMLSSPAPPYARSPCSARTLILLTDPITLAIYSSLLHWRGSY